MLVTAVIHVADFHLQVVSSIGLNYSILFPVFENMGIHIKSVIYDNNCISQLAVMATIFNN